MIAALVRCSIVWAVRRSLFCQRVFTFDDTFLFKRFNILWADEWTDWRGHTHNRPPFWRPFNVLLHCWRPRAGTEEDMHDHPRWSITICLRGQIVERTLWGERLLTPGSIVFRSHKTIHAFRVPDEHRGKTWTLFIVGRRNHRQNTYRVLAR